MEEEHPVVEITRRVGFGQVGADITNGLYDMAENPGWYIRGMGIMLVAGGISEAALKGEVVEGALIALGGVAVNRFAGLYERLRG